MQIPRHLGLIVLVVVIAAGLAYGLWPRAIPVEVVVARRGTLAVAIEEEGKTRVVERYLVSAPIDGYARRVALDVGDRVARGQTLAVLEPERPSVLDPRSRAAAQARLAAAQAGLSRAQETAQAAAAEADLAQTDAGRIRDLAARRLVAQSELDRAEARLRSAEAQRRAANYAVEVAQGEREAAHAALQFAAGEGVKSPQTVAIKAPVDGAVLKIYRESEGAVAVGTPLIEIGNPNALEVEVDVLSADAVRLQPGTPVRFERWGGEQTLQGAVRRIEPVGFTKVSALGVEEQRVWVIADLTSPPAKWQRLGDGYRVEATFVLWERDDVLQVPANALFRRGDGWAVYVVNASRAEQRAVQLGQRNGLAAQILQGIAEGEAVITHPSDEVMDGVRVKVGELAR